MRGFGALSCSIPSALRRTISPGPTNRSVVKPRLAKAELSELTAMAPSLEPMAMGVRPQASLAAMRPSSVRISIEHDPLTSRNTFSIPSTKVFPLTISRLTSSVMLIFPLLNSVRYIPSSRNFLARASALPTLATVTRANLPRWELTSIGWASVSLMIPIPELPVNLLSSSSNRLRKYPFSRLWMPLMNPRSGSKVARPPRRVPRWLL